MSRDSQTDASRDGSGQLRKESAGEFVNMDARTIADMKKAFPETTIGTRGDDAGVLDEYQDRDTDTPWNFGTR